MKPLSISKERLGDGARIPLEVLPDNPAVIRRFAEDLIGEYRAAKQAGRRKVVFILPVGPVGQYDLVAQWCNAEGLSLADLVAVNMDEYLTPDGRDLIPRSDPLSFRRHMDEHFFGLLDPRLAPPPDQRIFPPAHNPESLTRLIAAYGGADVCFGGIGITGHVAFNDPPEPGEALAVEAFRELPTRVVRLSRETRLINAVTAARGNVDRIPALAVTVGMKEILESRKIRIYMNREWQAAVVRKILHGPVTVRTPASLLQMHPDVRLTIADYVADLPEPQLR